MSEHYQDFELNCELLHLALLASRSPILLAVRRTKLCRSELPADNAMRRFNAPQPFLLPRVPILRFCDAFVTNFTAAEFRALYCSSTQEECSSS
ncbi:hypothetical protein EVAR_90412_1 [Eumeta japonica]|uniref:Uncharacterized protein n=1 Tax=Eumeta variegata TaxID=151549 RepID=A0A4C1Y8P2_EUMVA|nr:hypothetical protein EVAR_90412_1 [Eumeta japonica]